MTEGYFNIRFYHWKGLQIICSDLISHNRKQGILIIRKFQLLASWNIIILSHTHSLNLEVKNVLKSLFRFPICSQGHIFSHRIVNLVANCNNILYNNSDCTKKHFIFFTIESTKLSSILRD